MTDTKQSPIPKPVCTHTHTYWAGIVKTCPKCGAGLTAARPASTDDRVGVESTPIPDRWEDVRRQTHEYNWAAKQEDLLRCIEELGTALAKITALEAKNAELIKDRDVWKHNCWENHPGLKKVDLLQAKLTSLQASSQMLQVKLDAATEDRDKWLAEHNRLQRERDAHECGDTCDALQAKITALEATNSVLLQDSENREKQWKILYNLYGESKAELTALEAQLHPVCDNCGQNNGHLNGCGYAEIAIDDIETSIVNHLAVYGLQECNCKFHRSIAGGVEDLQAKVDQLTRERDAALVKWQAANNRAIAAELRSEDNL